MRPKIDLGRRPMVYVHTLEVSNVTGTIQRIFTLVAGFSLPLPVRILDGSSTQWAKLGIPNKLVGGPPPVRRPARLGKNMYHRFLGQLSSTPGW